MKVRAFDHVAVTVKDTERALEFYVGKLGLKQVEQHQLEGDNIDKCIGIKGLRGQSTRLQAPDTPNILIDLMEFYEPALGEAQPPMGAIGSTHFAMIVDDLPGAVEELRAKGVKFSSDPVTFEITGMSKGPNVTSDNASSNCAAAGCNIAQ